VGTTSILRRDAWANCRERDVEVEVQIDRSGPDATKH
jgi:hypothetical protein